MIASIILALHLMGHIAAPAAAAFLLISGCFLLFAEIVFTTGILALNGLLAIYVAYTLKYGESTVFGQPIGWDVLFGIAFVEIVILAVLLVIVLRLRKEKPSTGVESMIGHSAEVLEWNDKHGLVRIHGETWKATADQTMQLSPGENVKVAAIHGLTLKVTV